MNYIQNIFSSLAKQSQMDTNWKQQENCGNVNYFLDVLKKSTTKKDIIEFSETFLNNVDMDATVYHENRLNQKILYIWIPTDKETIHCVLRYNSDFESVSMGATYGEPVTANCANFCDIYKHIAYSTNCMFKGYVDFNNETLIRFMSKYRDMYNDTGLLSTIKECLSTMKGQHSIVLDVPEEDK